MNNTQCVLDDEGGKAAFTLERLDDGKICLWSPGGTLTMSETEFSILSEWMHGLYEMMQEQDLFTAQLTIKDRSPEQALADLLKQINREV